MGTAAEADGGGSQWRRRPAVKAAARPEVEEEADLRCPLDDGSDGAPLTTSPRSPHLRKWAPP
jgi:hypothetical protein